MRGRIALAVAVLSMSLVARADEVGLRIRFGMKDADTTEWSGKITASDAKIANIRGWRWMPGDHANGNEFTVLARRAVVQSRGDRQRVQQGLKMPMTDNGLIVTVDDAKPDTTIDFDAKQGHVSFKLADVPYGKKLNQLNGNLEVIRIPVAKTIADTIADEDYPCVAKSKDGTIYVAYLAFTHGKDFQGARERPATKESGPNAGPLAMGVVKHIDKPEDLDYLAEPTGGEQIWLKSYKDGKWSEPIAVTDGKNELYRPAIAIDGDGNVWVFYSAQLNADQHLDHGNWELMAQAFDVSGAKVGVPINVSNNEGSDFMPVATTDAYGSVWVAWVGGMVEIAAVETGKFGVFTAKMDGGKVVRYERVSDENSNAWEPSIAASKDGRVTVMWDSYGKGDYDIYMKTFAADGTTTEPALVAGTLKAEVRSSIAYDGKGNLWIAHEESGEGWGKDFGGLKKRGIPMYASGRAIAVRMLTKDGKWMDTPDVMDCLANTKGQPNRRAQKHFGANVPAGPAGTIAPCYPRLAIGEDDQVYVAFRGRPGQNWRVAVGSVWCEYVTRLDGSSWSDAVWMPRSNNGLDNRPAVLGLEDSLAVFYSGDGRGEMNPSKLDKTEAADIDQWTPGPGTDDDGAKTIKIAEDSSDKATVSLLRDDVTLVQQKRKKGGGKLRGDDRINNDLYFAMFNGSDFANKAKPPVLSGGEAPRLAEPIEITKIEEGAIKTVRDYRTQFNDETLRVWRGEFHRHTEYSFDGNNDGGLLDLWRYAIDCANMDWIGDGDHDYGGGREYTWWTTQKCVTLFTVPKRFVPMFCYERSVSYPEGHRNCMFSYRGVRTLPRLPISSRDVFAPAPDTNLLYMYLHHFGAICAPHTSATEMGTDWRNYDQEVEPMVEIYQGDRNNYERPDSPRSAVTEANKKQSTPEKESMGGWEPKGFVNLALLKGERLAFECSSDHISTHLAYCNVLINGEPTREAILDAVRHRRVYASTANFVADFRCKAGGKDHLMGEEFSTSEKPRFDIHFIGAYPIANVTIIKDDKVVYTASPNTKDVKFTWSDPSPESGKTSYYYVRAQQVPDMEGAEGELCWASPMWIKYEGK